MGHVKINLSMDGEVASTMRRRAAQEGKPISQYVAGLILEDERRQRDALAEEGYRKLSGDTLEFAEAAEPLAQETWPEWSHES